MVGSSIYTLLALVAIIIQTLPSTNARSRHHNSNTNINANINAHRPKSRRHGEDAILRADKEAEDTRQKESKEKILQTAVVASAAANAAKTVTRALAHELSETTADAVADAVARVLGAEEPTTTPAPNRKPKKKRLIKKVPVMLPDNKTSRRSFVDVNDLSDEDLEDLMDRVDADSDDESILRAADNLNLNSNVNSNRPSRRFSDPYDNHGYPWILYPGGIGSRSLSRY